LTEVRGQSYRDSGDGLKPVSDDDDDRIGSILSSPDLAASDRSFSEYLEHRQEAQETKTWLRSYVEGFNAADASCIGTWALLHQQMAEERIDGDRAWRLNFGFMSLVDSLRQQLPASTSILLNTVAKQIVWRPGCVHIEGLTQESETKSVHTKAAIITVPVGVLQKRDQNSAIVFDPEPRYFRQLNQLLMGEAVRLNLLFSEPVWETTAPNAGFILSLQEHFPTWWPRTSGDGYLLTGWSGGPKASRLPVHSTDHLLDLALGTLSKLFRQNGRQLRSKLQSVHYHDWHSDPYSCGAYSYVRAGAFAFSQEIARPIEQTLWFAGEAMALDGYWGTVHGAIESGRRAATQILSTI
jgi:monoamine oxidase